MQFRTVTVLGLLGLVPFFVFTVMILDNPNNIREVNAFYTYAAVMLSFLGGIHWGLLAQARSVGQSEPLKFYWLWSTIPPLVAWVALFFSLCWWGIVAIGLMYILQYLMDIRLAKCSLLPYWFLQLRRILTLLVTICFIPILVRLR